MLSASLSVSAAAPTSAIISNGWDPGKRVSNLVGAIWTYLRAAATAAAVASSWLNYWGAFLSFVYFYGVLSYFGFAIAGFVAFAYEIEEGAAGGGAFGAIFLAVDVAGNFFGVASGVFFGAATGA